VESSFFSKLSQLKLDNFKLDATSQPIFGTTTAASKLTKFITTPVVSLDYSSFETPTSASDANITYNGTLVNVNTFDQFKSQDKLKLLNEWGSSIYNDIIEGDLRNINRFYMYSFSDLKKYKFYYWVAFPTLSSSWNIVESNDEDLLKYVNSIAVDESNPFYQVIDDIMITENFKKGTSGRFIYVDSCLSNDKKPSIFLKNFLYYLAYVGFETIDLVVYRVNGSFQLKLSLDSFAKPPKVTGWERSAQGKLAPKLADLGSLIDPHQLASQAVDLNLKLMKWRIAPDIQLDIIKQQKVLLLGAGTLGSYISRALLGWGVRNITFIDNGRVSYSNPVRQPLFGFKDCFSDHGQGAMKAQKAAEALKEIFPDVNSRGIALEVPMIGHPPTSQTESNFNHLHQLVKDHDIMFLLMDSRESRWLPTVLGIAENKLVINAALGFDSYLVMRHGNVSEGDISESHEQLGCYYCNDIVAPDNSLADRTLDQMCTVTRPGAAVAASSVAVELMVSVLQHPEHKYAPANGTSKFGEVPHQIRGFLRDFSQSKFSSPSYKHCSACSTLVIQEFRNSGWEFIGSCLSDSKYLEEFCGLKTVQQDAELAIEDIEDIEDIDDEWLD
jgi:ubiquitin-like modifier-activating enzyme ATG7